MSNFSPKLEDASEKELRYMVNELDFRVVPLASDELTRRYIEDLNKTVKENVKQTKKFAEVTKEFNDKTSKQTEQMVWLTRLIAGLTVIMVLGLAVQIYMLIP